MISRVFVFCVVMVASSCAQTFETLASFDSTDGSFPTDALVQAFDGTLYGTTVDGGTYSCGTAFKISPDGTLKTVHSFNGNDGCQVIPGLIQGEDGNFYGASATGIGGTCESGYGTVFKMTSQGIVSVLYDFCTQASGSTGEFPYATLVQGFDGNFYGTTQEGGTGPCPVGGCGTIFKITSEGTLTTLHSFDGPDGYILYSSLVEADDGNFYGTTSAGGASYYYGYGTVFKITPQGVLTTLYSFCSTLNCADGSYPYAGLVQDSHGMFYGTTEYGGTGSCSLGCGTVFRITKEGVLTTLHSFDGTDGEAPYSKLALGSDGNLYGTTSAGGFYNWGTIFEITPSGVLTTLHTFSQTDGSLPIGGLTQATNGLFYGLTAGGGTSTACSGGGCGTAYRLSVGLGPFVTTQPTSGEAGAHVIILGNQLTGATSVTFNGAVADFKVISSTAIVTKVPSGATSGEVTVSSPTGALKSNIPFHVEP